MPSKRMDDEGVTRKIGRRRMLQQASVVLA